MEVVVLVAVRNVSPMGDVHLPLLGVDVEAGGVVTVTEEVAAGLLAQPENWQSADAEDDDDVVKGV